MKLNIKILFILILPALLFTGLIQAQVIVGMDGRTLQSFDTETFYSIMRSSEPPELLAKQIESFLVSSTMVAGADPIQKSADIAASAGPNFIESAMLLKAKDLTPIRFELTQSKQRSTRTRSHYEPIFMISEPVASNFLRAYQIFRTNEIKRFVDSALKVFTQELQGVVTLTNENRDKMFWCIEDSALQNEASDCINQALGRNLALNVPSLMTLISSYLKLYRVSRLFFIDAKSASWEQNFMESVCGSMQADLLKIEKIKSENSMPMSTMAENYRQRGWVILSTDKGKIYDDVPSDRRAWLLPELNRMRGAQFHLLNQGRSVITTFCMLPFWSTSRQTIQYID